MTSRDSFGELARYYDRIMDHVDYDRWFFVATALTELLPDSFRHLDAACGTGTLVKMLRQAGWNSIGADLSLAMVRHGRRNRPDLPLAAADLRALPWCGSLDYITCLFDSLNFLLEEADLRSAFREFSRGLTEDGLLYFDVVTERMVTDHFDGESWTEDNGEFRTTWSSAYDRNTGIADTCIRVNTGAEAVFRERVYPLKLITKAVSDAGMTLLATLDANTWRAPTRRTTRVDFVAVKKWNRAVGRRFRRVCEAMRDAIQRDVYGAS